MSEESRVVFYSIHDMSAGWNLEKAEKLLDTIDMNSNFSLTDYLEFYNIHQYFKNEIFLKKWSEDEKNKYKTISEELFKKTILFIKNIEESFILSYINEINNIYQYKKDFWELIEKFKVYDKISIETLNIILDSYPYYISFILKHKNIVNYFNEQIKLFLLKYERSGEILLDYVKSEKENIKIFFPASLTHEDKENIIIKYIENDTEAFGNLDLIQKLGDGFLKLSPKTKLKAKKMYEKRNEDFFKDSKNILKYGYQVSLSETQIEPLIIEKNTDGLPSFSYSVNFLNKFDFNSNPLGIFVLLFGFINEKKLINLVSKESEISVMEGLFSHWNIYDYKVSTTFRNKEMLSLLNLQILHTYLKKFRDSSLDDIINKYINNILSKISGLEKIQFQISDYDIPYQEKITNLIPKFDSFIKQYRCYVEEKKIDFELIDIDSRPISFENIHSLLSDKYFYELEDKLTNLIYLFYSDQSGLYYIDGYENKYNYFYDLIRKENVKIENFDNYQQERINYLLKEQYLYLDQDDYIKIKDDILIFLVGEIYREGVLSYYSYEDIIKNKIIEMKDKELLFSESKLLSKQETDYLDYYLNKSKFLNGPEIRNKNIHGYKYSTEDEAYTDYLTLLKIIILILLKIDLEINIKNI